MPASPSPVSVTGDCGLSREHKCAEELSEEQLINIKEQNGCEEKVEGGWPTGSDARKKFNIKCTLGDIS